MSEPRSPVVLVSAVLQKVSSVRCRSRTEFLEVYELFDWEQSMLSSNALSGEFRLNRSVVARISQITSCVNIIRCILRAVIDPSLSLGLDSPNPKDITIRL